MQFYKIWNQTKGSISSLLLDIDLEVLVKVIKQENEMKGIQIGNDEAKLFLITEGMIIYKEKSKDFKNRLLELRQFGKISGYKIDRQKSTVFV